MAAIGVRDRELTVWPLTPFVSYELYSFSTRFWERNRSCACEQLLLLLLLLLVLLLPLLLLLLLLNLPHLFPVFSTSPPLDLFSNLTIGLQKPWDRLRPMLWCHHRLRLTLWRPRHHKQHNLQQKYPPTSRRRKVPQKERPPHQPQTQRSQVSLFFSFLMLLIISGLICLWYLIPRRLLCQRQTSRHFLCNLSVSLCWQNEYS